MNEQWTPKTFTNPTYTYVNKNSPQNVLQIQCMKICTFVNKKLPSKASTSPWTTFENKKLPPKAPSSHKVFTIKFTNKTLPPKAYG